MRIAIIGGGAAGLMAAAAALEANPTLQVTLIDRNAELGKKVMISGGGRCNVTTGLRDIREVLKRYPRGGKFLNSAMRAFPPWTVRTWFEERGVPLKAEADLRVFPKSNDGRDIVGVFERLFAASKVSILLNRQVTTVTRQGTGFRLTFKDGDTLDCDRLILTTGGQAFRHTGSTGDGYAFAEFLGHRITPLAPSLNAFYVREPWIRELAGYAVPKATITAGERGEYEFTGPFLFTHRGVTGPAVFAVSSQCAYEKYGPERPMKILIDLRPDEKLEDLRDRIAASGRQNPKKALVNVLDFFMPKSLASLACRELKLDPQRHASEISDADYGRLAAWLKGLPLSVIGRDAGEEFVTAGGVDLAEVDQRTMESKLVPGLFFAGELLDIDGFTGGFNLQASWATGRAAGLAAGE